MHILKKISCTLAVAAMFAVICLTPHKKAYAAQQNQTPKLNLSFSAPDGTPVAGVKFSIVKVADAKWDDSTKYGHTYISLPVSSSMLIDDSMLKTDGGSARTIENTFYGKSFPGEASAKTASDGTITFKMSSPGLYVLWQSGSSGYKTMEPILLPIPIYRTDLGMWNYDVSANLTAQPDLSDVDGSSEVGNSGANAQTGTEDEEMAEEPAESTTSSGAINALLDTAKSLPEKTNFLPILLVIIAGVAGVGGILFAVSKVKEKAEEKKRIEKLNLKIMDIPEGKGVKVFKAPSGVKNDDDD